MTLVASIGVIGIEPAILDDDYNELPPGKEGNLADGVYQEMGVTDTQMNQILEFARSFPLAAVGSPLLEGVQPVHVEGQTVIENHFSPVHTQDFGTEVYLGQGYDLTPMKGESGDYKINNPQRHHHPIPWIIIPTIRETSKDPNPE